MKKLFWLVALLSLFVPLADASPPEPDRITRITNELMKDDVFGLMQGGGVSRATMLDYQGIPRASAGCPPVGIARSFYDPNTDTFLVIDSNCNVIISGGGGGSSVAWNQLLNPNGNSSPDFGGTVFTFSNGTWDWGTMNLILPRTPSFVPGTLGQIGFDTTSANLMFNNAVSNYVAMIPTSQAINAGDIASFSFSTGQISLAPASVNSSTGTSILEINTTNPAVGDIACITSISPIVEWDNCTPGAVDFSINGATSTYTIGTPDSNNLTSVDHDYAATAAATITLPTADDLDLDPGYVFVYSNHSTLIDDIVPSTWTINLSTDLQVQPNSFCRVRVDPFNATNWLADCADLGIPATPTPVNGLISGGGVTWTGLLHFTVSAAVYGIAGTQYASPQTNLTLAAADPTNPRIDVIAVDNTGAAVVITGTPAGSPAAPSVDPTRQLSLTFVTVAANATTPTLNNILVYDENLTPPTEYTCTPTAHFNCNSTNNPFHGSKDIEVTTAVAGNNVALVNSGTVNFSTYAILSFNIRNKAAWPAAKSLSICFLNSATVVGNCLGFKNGVYGFNQANTTGYQQIVIPLSAFALGSTVADRVRFQVAGGGGSIGFYLDWIQIQSNLAGAGAQQFQLEVNGANTQVTANLADSASVTFTQTVANGVSTIKATTAGSTALSSITAATTNATIQSGGNKIEWDWNALTSSALFGLKFAETTAAASGNPAVIEADTAASSPTSAINVLCGANPSNKCVNFSVSGGNSVYVDPNGNINSTDYVCGGAPCHFSDGNTTDVIFNLGGNFPLLISGNSSDAKGTPVTMSNNASTGPTINKLVCLTGAPSTATICGSGVTSGIVGICYKNCTVSGTNATSYVMSNPGDLINCVFDATAITAGDYVTGGTSGACHDAGSTLPASQVVGVAQASAAASSTVQVLLMLSQGSATHANHGLVFTMGDVTNTSALTTSNVAYLRVPFACTIQDYSIMADAGTMTIKFWKVASGTAIPTSGNSISTSGVSLSSGTAIISTTLSDFTTTSVAKNDMMAAAITAVATAKTAIVELSCQE